MACSDITALFDPEHFVKFMKNKAGRVRALETRTRSMLDTFTLYWLRFDRPQFYVLLGLGFMPNPDRNPNPAAGFISCGFRHQAICRGAPKVIY